MSRAFGVLVVLAALTFEVHANAEMPEAERVRRATVVVRVAERTEAA